MFRFLVLAVCVASVSGVFAQQSKLEIYFNQVRAGKYPSIPTEITKPENASNALSVLNGYLNDSIVFVRQRAASVSRYIGTQSKVNAVRTKAVDQLVMAAKDKDNGNVGAALLYLTEFKKKDLLSLIRTHSTQYLNGSRHISIFLFG